jgi:hypothetical protein
MQSDIAVIRIQLVWRIIHWEWNPSVVLAFQFTCISHDFLVWITLNSFTWHRKPCANQCYLSLMPVANLLCPVAVRMCHSGPWQIFAIGISARHISECDILWQDLSYVWFVSINWDLIVLQCCILLVYLLFVSQSVGYGLEFQFLSLLMNHYEICTWSTVWAHHLSYDMMLLFWVKLKMESASPLNHW